MKLKWIVIPAVIVAVTIIMFHFKKNRDIPVKLIGKWVTSAPGYEDRFIEITKETFVYGLGRDKIDAYMISGLERKQEEQNIVYTIKYKNTEVTFTRSFYYHPENDGTIQFKHQEHIEWCKEKGAAFEENSETDQKSKGMAT